MWSDVDCFGMMSPYYTKAFTVEAVLDVLRKAAKCQTTALSCHRRATRYVCLSTPNKFLSLRQKQGSPFTRSCHREILAYPLECPIEPKIGLVLALSQLPPVLFFSVL